MFSLGILLEDSPQRKTSASLSLLSEKFFGIQSSECCLSSTRDANSLKTRTWKWTKLYLTFGSDMPGLIMECKKRCQNVTVFPWKHFLVFSLKGKVGQFEQCTKWLESKCIINLSLGMTKICFVFLYPWKFRKVKVEKREKSGWSASLLPALNQVNAINSGLCKGSHWLFLPLDSSILSQFIVSIIQLTEEDSVLAAVSKIYTAFFYVILSHSIFC